MKLTKQIFIVVRSLTIVSVISAILAIAITGVFGTSFWYMFLLIAMLQLLFPSCYDMCMDKIVLKRQLDIYNEKEYKRYPIQTACQHCGDIVVQSLDLDDSQYQCANCGKNNAIHVTYMVAAIPSTPNTYNL